MIVSATKIMTNAKKKNSLPIGYLRTLKPTGTGPGHFQRLFLPCR